MNYGIVLLEGDEMDHEREEERRKTFKETNWWAKHHFSFTVVMTGLYIACFIFALFGQDMERFTKEEMWGLVAFLAFLTVIFMIAFSLTKHYTYELPWRKFRAKCRA